MSNYRRLISYIYAYEGGIKGKNVGFAKLEVRNGQCKLQVNVRNVYIGSQDTGVYLLSESEEILVGKIFIRNGAGEFRAMLSVNNVAGSGQTIDQCYGLTVHNMADSWQSYTTIWEDAVAHAAEVALSEATSERLDKRERNRLPETRGAKEKPDNAQEMGKLSISEAIEAEIEAQSQLEEQKKEKLAKEKFSQERHKQERHKQERQGQEAGEESAAGRLKTGQVTEMVPPSEIAPLESPPQFLRPSDMEAMEVKHIKLIEPIASRVEMEEESVFSEGKNGALGGADESVPAKEAQEDQGFREESSSQTSEQAGPEEAESEQHGSEQLGSEQTESEQPAGQPPQMALPQSGPEPEEFPQPESQQADFSQKEPALPGLGQTESRPRPSLTFRQNWWSPVFSGQGRLNRTPAPGLVQNNQEPRQEQKAEGTQQGIQVQQSGQEQRAEGMWEGSQTQQGSQMQQGGQTQQSGQMQQGGRIQQGGQMQQSGQEQRTEGEQEGSQAQQTGQEQQTGGMRQTGQEQQAGWSQQSGQEQQAGWSQQTGREQQAGWGQQSGQGRTAGQWQQTRQEQQVRWSQQSGQGRQAGQWQQTRKDQQAGWGLQGGPWQQVGRGQQTRQDQQTGQWQPAGENQQTEQGQTAGEGCQTEQGQPGGRNRETEQWQPGGRNRETEQWQSGGRDQQTEQQQTDEGRPADQGRQSGQIGQMGQIDPGKLEDEPKIDVIWQHFYKSYPKIQAFDYKGGCDILTIKPQDIGLLPREVWGYGNNSFLLHGYYSHRYLIFARLNSPKGEPRFLLGVPGHYYSNEKYMASMFGFPNFVLSKIQPAGDGRFGYWYTDIHLG